MPVQVLNLEDNPADARLIREYLRESTNPQFELCQAATLRDARRRLEERSYDMIVMDLNLPDTRGLETFYQVQSMAPETPILVMTGLNDGEAGARAVTSGAQDFLVKGRFDPEGLVQRLRYALERHRIQAQLFHLATQLRQANAGLERLSLTDPLTQLYNRRGLEEVLLREAGSHARPPMMVMLVDVDDFKKVNDLLGHDVGDLVLKEIAARLKETLRNGDHVARVGGDEFIVLLPGTETVEGVRIAERLRLAISNSGIALPSGPFKVTASLGLVVVSNLNVSIEELLAMTHHSLYKSKREGKNRISYDWAGGPEQSRREGDAIVAALRQGDRLRVVKQGIYELPSEKLSGFEFLSRQDIPGFGNPDEFLPVAASSNLLTLVDQQCLNACLAASAALAGEADIHVNIFASTLLALPLERLLEHFPPKWPRARLCLEINEQQISAAPAQLAERVAILRRAGLRVALDDVGYGRSYLENLLLLEPDVLKIDKKLVIGLAGDAPRRRAVQRLLKVAHSLGATVVAEGVENRQDLAALIDLGVTMGQGFLWGKPA